MYDVRRCVEYDSRERRQRQQNSARPGEALWTGRAPSRVCFSSVYHCERGQSILSHALSLRDTLVPGNTLCITGTLGGSQHSAGRPALVVSAHVYFLGKGFVRSGASAGVRKPSLRLWPEELLFLFSENKQNLRACLYEIKGMVDSKMTNQLLTLMLFKIWAVVFFLDERWDIQHNVDTIVISV